MTTDFTAGMRATRQAGPHMIQMLTPEGERVSSGEYDVFAAELGTEDLFGFYRDMTLVRRVDA